MTDIAICRPPQPDGATAMTERQMHALFYVGYTIMAIYALRGCFQ